MKAWVPLITAVTLVAVHCALAGVLIGTVKDEEGKPMANINVSVWGKDIKGKTDSKGDFRIQSEELLVGNRYAIKVEAEGYDSAQTFSTEIFADESDMEPLDLTVYKEQEIELDIPTNFPPGMMGYTFGATNRIPVATTNEAVSDGSMDIDVIDIGGEAETNTSGETTTGTQPATGTKTE